jgi:tRNA-dihydrouridine synthase
VLVSGGLRTPAQARRAFEQTGAAAVLLARGSLGNPWLFAQLLQDAGGAGAREPTREEILSEFDWVIERAVEHLGPERGGRYLRKFYPWYLERLGLSHGRKGRELLQALQSAPDIDAARALLRWQRPGT